MKPKILATTIGLDRNVWLNIRRQGVGGSDAAAILGLNPYQSAFGLYMDKLGLAPETEETEAMWLGTQLEPIIAERFERETGMTVQRRNVVYQHADHPWMLANIDRWIVGRKAGLEIKTTNMLNRTRFDDGDVPPYYYIQCMHYMAVTDADEWYLAIAVLNRSFHIFHVERNESEIEALIAAEKDFWENNVLKQDPPPPDGSAAAGELVKALFPRERGNAVLTPLFGSEDKLERIQALEEQIKGLEKESDALKQAIQLELGKADGGKASGYTVWWRTQTRTSVDTKRLQKEQPEIYRQYEKSTEYRKFEIRKDKKEDIDHG
jgi:putative phage-type endonuclease